MSETQAFLPECTEVSVCTAGVQSSDGTTTVFQAGPAFTGPQRAVFTGSDVQGPCRTPSIISEKARNRDGVQQVGASRNE